MAINKRAITPATNAGNRPPGKQATVAWNELAKMRAIMAGNITAME